jgi:hypothetical protein
MINAQYKLAYCIEAAEVSDAISILDLKAPY